MAHSGSEYTETENVVKKDCRYCLEKILDNYPTYTHERCGAIFHNFCINRYLMGGIRSGNSPWTCPVCVGFVNKKIDMLCETLDPPISLTNNDENISSECTETENVVKKDCRICSMRILNVCPSYTHEICGETFHNYCIDRHIGDSLMFRGMKPWTCPVCLELVSKRVQFNGHMLEPPLKLTFSDEELSAVGRNVLFGGGGNEEKEKEDEEEIILPESSQSYEMIKKFLAKKGYEFDGRLYIPNNQKERETHPGTDSFDFKINYYSPDEGVFSGIPSGFFYVTLDKRDLRSRSYFTVRNFSLSIGE